MLELDNVKNENSARLPDFSKLTTSKTKQFCETSFKNGKLSAELTASYQCVLRFFHSTYLKYCAGQEKAMPDHTKCCSALTSYCNISDEHVSSTAPATENVSLQILFKCPMPAIVFGDATKIPRFAHFWQGAQSLAPATQNDATLQRPKVDGHEVLCTCWLGNVLRATTACTFSTSQL